METGKSSSKPQGEPACTGTASETSNNASAKGSSGSTREPVPKSVSASKGPKKRTKTGCLTCRKRRIKCGEEKPICNNCIKSKRECEGYTQRVIFKHPLGTMGAFQSRPVTLPELQRMSMRMPHQGRLPLPQPSGTQQPILAPQPPDLSATGYPGVDSSGLSRLRSNQAASDVPFFYPQGPVSVEIRPPAQQYSTSIENGYTLPSAAAPSSAIVVQHQIYQVNGVSSQSRSSCQQLLHTNHDRQGVSKPAHLFLENHRHPLHQANRIDSANNVDWSAIEMPIPSQTQLQWTTQKMIPTGHCNMDGFLQSDMNNVPQTASHMECNNDDSDDYYDVESDEEMTDQTQAEGFSQLSLIMASASQDEHQLRSFTTHLNEPNILASYRPTMGSSPLSNPKTARIFVHFIHATGPALSTWERHPTDSSIVLGAPVPTAQQGLWTYTLPLRAFENQALLQAILAISSLHIANLQQAPITVSLKHYHYALKKVGVAVGLPLRRKQTETLAATLLLGFYEVMAAEHAKWSSHVAGSAQLIKEIDFAGLTRDIRAHRRRVKAQKEQMTRSGLWSEHYQHFGDSMSEDDPFGEIESDLNEDLIGTLMGRPVDYDKLGQVQDEDHQSRPKYFTKKDIENYRIQGDLYWWYAKQDIFQSLISGNQLLTPYDQLVQCPPRAGMGKLDAIYGSWDHLLLLLARLTDFSHRDRKRKLKFWKGWAGGPSGPPSGYAGNAFPAGGPVGGFPDRTPSGAKSSPFGQDELPQQREEGSPPMYGMAPSRGPVRLPSAFANTACTLGSSPDSVEEDEVESTVSEAEAEWESILTAFDVFGNALGPGYSPLPPDSITPISTTFGPALQYRTHTIAVLWAYYYAGRILLHRLHPSMPPAMMVAVGAAAATTANYAQIIGRITAGVYCPQQYNIQAGGLSPTLGGALTEITVPVFFAAVQYTDPAQRGWTIAKLHDISHLTGWQTSSAIARGCETAWVNAAKKGRGPPYEYTTNRHTNDVRGSGRPVPSQRTDGPVVKSTANTDRRFVTVNQSARTRSNWALGLLALEEDILNLELEDKMPR
ncbi:hypothetical protein VTN00DRAFT_82 [Thermoascus crustaceus]|uniref:uncharacterized protein n=1 Tax=Thermoascus crustaceus TaxID=5088 RepID=UPI003743ACDC